MPLLAFQMLEMMLNDIVRHHSNQAHFMFLLTFQMLEMMLDDVVRHHTDQAHFHAASSHGQLESAKAHKGRRHPRHHRPGLQLHVAVVEHVPVNAVSCEQHSWLFAVIPPKPLDAIKGHCRPQW